MPRDNNGVYGLPNPPFQPQSTIRSQEVNGNFEDIAETLTSSLDRYGAGGMAAPLLLADGSAAVPSLSYTLEPTLGFYRGAVSNVRLVGAGAVLQEWALTYTNINRPLAVTSPVQDTTAVTATGNGTGHGAVVTGGTPTGNQASGIGLIASAGAPSGSGGGAVGLRATGTGGSVGGEFIGGIRVNSSPLGPPGGTETQSGVLADVVMAATGDYNPACVLRALIPTQIYKNEINARVRSKVPNATSFDQVSIGLSGDVSGTMGLIGQFWFDGDAPMMYRSVGSPSSATLNTAALALMNGNLRMEGANLNANIPAKNTLAPSSMPKVWASFVSTNGGNGTPLTIGAQAGFGVASANLQNISLSQQVTALGIRVVFATPFLNTSYCPRVEISGGITFSQTGGTGGAYQSRVFSKATTHMDIVFFELVVDPGGPSLQHSVRLASAVPGEISVMVFGFQ